MWLGVALAMDATAVSMSNGLAEPKMHKGKWFLIAGAFALFQALMPMIGYFAGHALLKYIGPYVPWIALILLGFLGGKMLVDGIKGVRKQKLVGEQATKEEEVVKSLTIKTLLLQAVATSIDALSVGLSVADYTIPQALIAAAMIAVITFGLCILAVFIGTKFGDKLGNKAVILGGIILIGIGLEIFLTGIL